LNALMVLPVGTDRLNALMVLPVGTDRHISLKSPHLGVSLGGRPSTVCHTNSYIWCSF